MISRRRMVRNYDADRPVPQDARDRLLRAALRAPSAGFTQGVEYLVLDDAADRERFWAATTPADKADRSPTGRWLTGMRRAPLLVVCLSHRRAYLDRYREPDKDVDDIAARWPVPYWHVDAGFAALLVLLAAVDEGLGACFFGVDADRVAALAAAFGIPPDFTPVGVVSVGYPARDHTSRSLGRRRRTPGEVVHYGSW